MTKINWPREFSANEWPSGAIDRMDPKVFNDCLFPLRQLLGVPMRPSQLLGAHVRDTGTSRHSNTGGRLSDATDMHVPKLADMVRAYSLIRRVPAIGGFGMYWDTNEPLIHIDARPDKLCWQRINGKFIYDTDSVAFHKALGEQINARVRP